MSGYDPKTVWQFVDYSSKLDVERRLQKTNSVATLCYILARMGQTNIKRTLSILKQFLSEIFNLTDPVSSALSNMWVLNPRETSSLLLASWTVDRKSETVQEVAVESCRYLGSHEPARVTNFLERVSRSNQKRVADRAGRLLQTLLHNEVAKKKYKSQKGRKQKLR